MPPAASPSRSGPMPRPASASASRCRRTPRPTSSARSRPPSPRAMPRWLSALPWRAACSLSPGPTASPSCLRCARLLATRTPTSSTTIPSRSRLSRLAPRSTTLPSLTPFSARVASRLMTAPSVRTTPRLLWAGLLAPPLSTLPLLLPVP
ncbi:hypothetical protein B0J13DRAFT_566424 [Dactylonectria estremocensis]|uniref:Uncharacterized protein n=1 Tax=Dactylonectria estremocensis TaxID=1079267 RepID=A0A9P9IL45_9HYPO|nr:hypothetical protein B0J13DRAFT_566424 [Dactylonectria estremocensis]